MNKYPWPASAISAAEMAVLYRAREISNPKTPISKLIARAIGETYGETYGETNGDACAQQRPATTSTTSTDITNPEPKDDHEQV